MQKTFILFLVLISISCGNQSQKNQENEIAEEQDFEILGFSNTGFHTRPNNDKGSVFETTMTVQNNTDNKITSFDMTYLIEGIYSDNEHVYFPGGGRGAKRNLDEVFDIHAFFPTIKLEDFSETKVWLPETNMEFDLKVPGNLFAGIFYNEEFERTPTELTLLIKYTAISVDQEYSYVEQFDILDYWKNYQTEIGLR